MDSRNVRKRDLGITIHCAGPANLWSSFATHIAGARRKLLLTALSLNTSTEYLVYWLLREVTAMGFVETVSRFGRLASKNPIAIGLIGVVIALFRFFCVPQLVASLEDPSSFLSRVGLLVVGALVLASAVVFGGYTWNLIAARP